MTQKNKPQPSDETILLTLDQLDQTLEVMTDAVDRLRGQIHTRTNTGPSTEPRIKAQSFIVENKKPNTLH